MDAGNWAHAALTLALAALCCAQPSRAGEIAYDAQDNCITVTGFPEDAPATLSDLLDADRRQEWAKVAHDRQTDTFTVSASLWVGDSDPSGAFMQIGTPAHPRATLAMRGTIWVRPPFIGVARSDGSPSIVNRVRIGDPEAPDIGVTVRFDCDQPGEFGLRVGLRTPEYSAYQGALHVYNSTVTAAADRPWGSSQFEAMYGSDVRLLNSTFSHFRGRAFYGAPTGTWDWRVLDVVPNRRCRIEGCTFEHGDVGARGMVFLKNCVFRHMATALGGSSLGGTALNCSFRDNAENWAFNGYSGKRLLLIDCSIGPQSKPLTIRKNVKPSRTSPEYPCCRVMRSLVIRVADRAGEPVQFAAVRVSHREDQTLVHRGQTLTGPAGTTGADPERDAILVTTTEYVATDVADKPLVRRHGYDVNVIAAGHRRTVCIEPRSAIPRPLAITLPR